MIIIIIIIITIITMIGITLLLLCLLLLLLLVLFVLLHVCMLFSCVQEPTHGFQRMFGLGRPCNDWPSQGCL